MPQTELMPVLFLPHGGGPLPVMGDEGHRALVEFFKSIPQQIETPEAILMISAHWEEAVVTVMRNEAPAMLFDYYGFPPETYHYSYPAPGSISLSDRVTELLNSAGIESKVDEQRGFDHGTFIPLMLTYPEADIPVVQLSLQGDLDPQQHIDLGKVLAPLRKEKVLIVGSGMSFHSFPAMRDMSRQAAELSGAFDSWLADCCCGVELSLDEKEQQLVNWLSAPAARYCHPREEHLIPLHVCFGAAKDTPVAEHVFKGEFSGKAYSGFLWS